MDFISKIEGVAIAVILAGAVYGLFWLFAALRRKSLARDRAWLERHFAKRDEKLLDARLRFMKRGEMADEGVHYDVRYEDGKGRTHSASAFIATPSRTIHLSDDEIDEDA